MEKSKAHNEKIMKYLGCVIILIGCSYQTKIINSNNYKKALEDLSYHNKRENIELLKKRELVERSIFIFGNDTVYFKPDKNSFGFRNVQTGILTLYKFNQYGDIYTRIECNDKWQVLQMNPVTVVY